MLGVRHKSVNFGGKKTAQMDRETEIEIPDILEGLGGEAAVAAVVVEILRAVHQLPGGGTF